MTNPSTIVVGLGNPILSDDAVGVLVARGFQKQLASCPDCDGVSIVEASVGGMRLTELLEGHERAVIVDAFLPDGRPSCPGAVRIMPLEEVEEPHSGHCHLTSAHDTTLQHAVRCGRMLGMTLPDEIVVVAIEVENVTDFGQAMTPAVAAGIPAAISAVFNYVKEE